jgi:hypothetical protein
MELGILDNEFTDGCGKVANVEVAVFAVNGFDG